MTSKRERNHENLITQQEIDELLAIHELIRTDESGEKSLIDEIKDAILDSAKLTLAQWRSLRDRIREIEILIPHIDLIIELKDTDDRRQRILES